jgi:hypothetical protein
MTEEAQREHDGDVGVVHPEVIGPGSLNAHRFKFHETVTVSHAAAEAARELGYRAQNPGFQNDERVRLDPEQTLVQAGVNNGYVLFLIDTAGGQ